ncbi:helix-turn-helix domain-containing protein [Haladaptatus caseinilyticus]|uniref:helix-turn-helix domain-containing protein n=1 Tax=Haladaptatus caseinilyticus TaxID=2993314 RepID=UPI00224A75BC|nr:helix-turn-helix domain-containing protein [Haladaptatus caseinilyticus]
MSIEIDIRIDADEFAFGQVFQTMSALRIEFDRIVPTGREDEFLPFVWVAGTQTTPDPEGIEEAFASSDDIAEFELLTIVEEKRLYRLQWQPSGTSLLDGVRQTKGTIIEGFGEHGIWTLRLRFGTQADLSRFDNYCQNHEIQFALDKLRDVYPPDVFRLGLTPEQLEAIRTAYNQGYYEIPRKASQKDISRLLGISHQAASERLRRANKKIIERSMGPLIDGETEDE